MKDKIFGVLQRVGRSFMLPIAILPVAGLLLGIGSSFTNATMIETYGLQAILGDGTILHGLLTMCWVTVNNKKNDFIVLEAPLSQQHEVPFERLSIHPPIGSMMGKVRSDVTNLGGLND